MSETIIMRSPEIIAAEINQIKRTTAQYVLAQSIEIGRLLVEAKQTVNHGEWGGWLEANFEYSQSTANNLMRIYQEYGEDAQLSFFEDNRLELYGNLSRSQAVALLALPAAERAEFVQENPVETMSVSEIEEAIKKAKEEAKEEAAKEADENWREDYEMLEKREASARGDLEIMRRKAENAEARASQVERVKAAEVEELNRRLKEAEKKAKASAASEKELNAAKEEAANLREQIKALEEDLDKPAEITDEMKAEIEAAARAESAARIEQLTMENKKLAMQANPAISEFKVAFDMFQQEFNRLRGILASADMETAEKLKGALVKALDQMRAAV